MARTTTTRHRTGAAITPRMLPEPGGITPPLRITAAAIGITLVAVPFATTVLRGGPTPAHQRPAATFRVDDRDMNTYWPAP